MGRLPDDVSITTRLSDVVVKTVGKAKAGQVGQVYLPKEWIGSEVYIVKKTR